MKKMGLVLFGIMVVTLQVWSQNKMNVFEACLDQQMENPVSKYCNRTDLIGNSGIDSALFLSQIWGIFGKPHAITYEGFIYQLRQKSTGIVFLAYSGASGPAYSFSQKDFDIAKVVLDEFEKLLGTQEPVDCEITIENDFGKYRIGYRNGKRVEEKIER